MKPLSARAAAFDATMAEAGQLRAVGDDAKSAFAALDGLVHASLLAV